MSTMSSNHLVDLVLFILIVVVVFGEPAKGKSQDEKSRLKEKALEMFEHAYNSYMENAYPADELMPLSCEGRGRNTHPSRGDVDDALGNFSLTLIDTLDTLAVLGLLQEFEKAIKLIIKDVSFDTDIVVSVFETNIRVLGGLLGAHAVAIDLMKNQNVLHWYNNELLDMAKDIGYRLLPAFNTSTGIPYPRVNLRHGLCKVNSRAGHEKDTCTACAGTMILEFAALSRMTGEPVFEEKAHKAMEFLWEQRHRSSDLVGTVINIHNGDWVRRESGVGAGIDSYYEYLLKAYVLLGDETYLERFNKHYSAIMQYISQGPLLVDVHMHRPDRNSRNFMDALLAFWPGLQVLKGDIKSAIEIHEMLYQVTKRHNFLPEAFTTDFRVHWGQHPLRPEFVESTYFLYKATGDPYYLEVGESIMNNLEQHARVRCGFAAIKDVTTGTHENQMDSFVLAETFKYLYLLFSEPKDLVLNVDNYIFTTEAHLLPLTLSMQNHTMNITRVTVMPQVVSDEDENFDRSCRNIHMQFQGNLKFYAQNIRKPMENYVEQLCPKPKSHSTRARRLRAAEFIAGNKEHLVILKEFGIRLATLEDGRVQLLHTASDASSPEDAQEGMTFMQEMIELSKSQQQEAQQEPRVVQLMSAPYNGQTWMSAGPALFGPDLKNEPNGVRGRVIVAVPFDGCAPLTNANDVLGRIAIVERGGCMFVDKARNIERAGGIGGIVLDSHMDTTSSSSPLFAMSGDGKTEVSVPFLFLFRKEGDELLEALRQNPPLSVLLAVTPIKEDKQKETGSKTLLVKGTDNNYIVIAENKLNGNTDYEVSVQFGRVTLEFKISPYSNTDIESHLSDSENRNFKFTSEVKGSGMENMFVTYDGVIPVDEDSKPESVYVNKAVKKMLLKISQGQENEDVSDLLSRDEVIDEYNKALTHVIVTGFSGESAKIDERTVHLFNMIPGLVGGDVQVAREFFKDVIQKAEKADIPRGPEHYANAGDLTELQATQTQSTYPFGFSVQIAPAWMKVSDKHVYINGVEKIIYVTKEEYEKYVAKQGSGKVESSEVNLESSESEDNKKSGNEKVENSDLNQESSELTDELENDRGILGDQITDEMLEEVRSTVTKDGAEVNQDSEDPYQKLLDHIQREVDLLKLKSEEEEESIEAITREYSKEQTVDTTTQVFHQLNSASKQHGAGGVETDLENQNKVVLEVTKPTDISSERQDSGDAVGQHGGNDDRTLESDDSKRDEL